MPVRYTSLALLLAFFVITAQASTPYELGWDAFQSRNYKLAHSIWLPLAEKGDGDAALGLAVIYENGLIATKDPVTATKWYQMAAEQGIAEARHDLGIKYFTGQGVEQDQDKAYELWKQAAESGLSAAQTKFAYLHIHGISAPQDFDTAIKWYRQAASQGNTEAMYNIGLMYQKGVGVPENRNQHLRWLTMASDRGYPRAQYDLGLMKLHGNEIDRSVTEGKQLLLKAANNNSADAQYYLGTLYLNGHILRPDKELAIKLLQRAAEHGHKNAKQALIDIDNLAKTDDSLIIGKTSPQPAPETKPAAAQTLPSVSSPDNTIVLNKKLVESDATTPDPEPLIKQATDRSTWLMAQDTEAYTIQLMATTQQDRAAQYLKKMPDSINPFLYSFKKGSDTWYAVAAGIHMDFNQARQALKYLPTNVRKNSPWIRSVGALQQIIASQ